MKILFKLEFCLQVEVGSDLTLISMICVCLYLQVARLHIQTAMEGSSDILHLLHLFRHAL